MESARHDLCTAFSLVTWHGLVTHHDTKVQHGGTGNLGIGHQMEEPHDFTSMASS